MDVFCSSCRFVAYRSGISKSSNRAWGQITLVSSSGEELRFFVSSDHVSTFNESVSRFNFGDMVDLTLKISPMGNAFRVTAVSICEMIS